MPAPNTDENMRAAILTIFASNSRIISADLRLGVLNSIVHLAGVVDSLEIRNSAEELVKLVPGVRGVVNRIEAPGAPNPARTVNLNLSC